MSDTGTWAFFVVDDFAGLCIADAQDVGLKLIGKHTITIPRTHEDAT